MKQSVMTSPGRIEFRDIPFPVPAANEVLIRMKRIGVCGSDIHVWHGKHALTPYPVVQGHEVSGIIEKVGSSVRGLAPGQAVTIQPQVTCGTCYPCTHGAYHICDSLKVMGFQTTGAGSEYFAVEASKVLKLPPKMDLEHGAMIEPAAVAVHALGRAGNVSGMKVLVLGAGPIGNLVAQSAKGLGAAEVMITDVSDFRLAKAKAKDMCGPTACVLRSLSAAPASSPSQARAPARLIWYMAKSCGAVDEMSVPIRRTSSRAGLGSLLAEQEVQSDERSQQLRVGQPGRKVFQAPQYLALASLVGERLHEEVERPLLLQRVGGAPDHRVSQRLLLGVALADHQGLGEMPAVERRWVEGVGALCGRERLLRPPRQEPRQVERPEGRGARRPAHPVARAGEEPLALAEVVQAVGEMHEAGHPDRIERNRPLEEGEPLCPPILVQVQIARQELHLLVLRVGVGGPGVDAVSLLVPAVEVGLPGLEEEPLLGGGLIHVQKGLLHLRMPLRLGHVGELAQVGDPVAGEREARVDRQGLSVLGNRLPVPDRLLELAASEEVLVRLEAAGGGVGDPDPGGRELGRGFVAQSLPRLFREPVDEVGHAGLAASLLLQGEEVLALGGFEDLDLDGVHVVEPANGGQHESADSGGAGNFPAQRLVDGLDADPPLLTQQIEHPHSGQHPEPLRLLE